MRVKHDNVQLILTSDEQALARLKRTIPEWQNLSERTWYPPDMPQTMVFTIEVEGKIVGGVELVNIRWFNRKAEITIWLLPEFRGQGLAKKALDAICRLAFEQLNLHRLEAEVYEFNTAARNLFTKARFVTEGTLREAKFKDGTYFNIIRFGLLKREWKKEK